MMHNLGMLERSNLAGNVADLLRESIANGKIPPGTRLIETEIAKQLNVSRGPVREAFRILESEGLLENWPGHGTFVHQPTERDIREVYSLRCLLEEEAFRLAAQRRTEEDLARLESTLQALFKAARENDHAKVRDLDVMLHRQIWEIADHHRLCNALNGLLTQVRMYVGVQTLTYSDLPAGISDHQILLEALRTQDIDLGLQMIRKHLGLAAEMVLDYYKKASSQ